MSTQFENDWILFLAARSGDLVSARKKLEEGANPNFVEPTNKNRPSLRPSSVLLRAVGCGHADFVELLLNAGAFLPKDEEDRERLSYSAKCADSPTTLLLLFRRGLPPTRDDADWAEEKGYSAVQDFADERLGAYEITYDIDEFLTFDVHRFFNDFYSRVPEYHSIHDHLLFPEERVVRDLWEFAVDTGSGFTSLISNEHFDTVARAHSALSKIGNSLAAEAVSELRATMTKCGFPFEPAGCLNHLTEISEEMGAIFDTEIESLDRKYFTGDRECSLWHDLGYLERGMEFARGNIDKLRERKRRDKPRQSKPYQPPCFDDFP